MKRITELRTWPNILQLQSPKNPRTDDLYAEQKRRSMDFEALKLCWVRSGIAVLTYLAAGGKLNKPNQSVGKEGKKKHFLRDAMRQRLCFHYNKNKND